MKVCVLHTEMKDHHTIRLFHDPEKAREAAQKLWDEFMLKMEEDATKLEWTPVDKDGDTWPTNPEYHDYRMEGDAFIMIGLTEIE